MSQIERKSGEPLVVPAPAPASESSGQAAKKKIDTSKMDLREYVKHVALWNDPLLSAKILFGLTVVSYFTCGENSYSVLGFVTVLLIERTIAVFALIYLSQIFKSKENALVKRAGEGLEMSGEMLRNFTKLPDEKTIKFWLDGMGKYLETKVIAGFSELQEAENDIHKMKVVLLHLFAFFIVFWLFSVDTLIFLTFYVGLVVPPIYVRQKEKIDPLLEKAHDAIRPHVETAKLKLNEVLEKAASKLEDAKLKASTQLEKTKTQMAEKVQNMRKSEDSAAAKKTN